MERIMNDAVDQFVSNRVFYGDNTYVYEDAKKTKKVSAEVLADAFIKGMVVVVGDTKFVPVSIFTTPANDSAIRYETIAYITETVSESSSTIELKKLRSTNE